MARRALAFAAALALVAAAGASASSRSITKNEIGRVAIAAGATRTLSVPYPDALEYANARYSGEVNVGFVPSAAGAAPDLARVRILQAQSVEGGSLYSVRAHNANARGTAPVALVVIATTVEPLPHR